MTSERYDAPAILSFFIPGLGQIVKDEIWKGIGLMLGALISIGLMFVVIGLLTYPFVWFYAVYDAYNTPIQGTEKTASDSTTDTEATEDGEGGEQGGDDGADGSDE
ncbi:MAG: DUF5683 domain-containing protein [Candidatus Nanohaloarchaea archaeon]|nr:DUF5683 domain-containing protein [Candidatus Nanohaloarchaea archaeon]